MSTSPLTASPVTRRDALRFMTLGLATTVAGCKQAEDILPYVVQPEGAVPGTPIQFATCLPLSGYGRGVLVTSIDGRPIKVSGNALHAASLGATDVFAEADILGLYDPDRSQAPSEGTEPRSWDAFAAALRDALQSQQASHGAGLRILTGRATSPTLLRQLSELQAGRFAYMRWHRYEPVADDHARQGSRLAHGRRLDIVPYLSRAEVVVSLGADPLGHGPDQIRNAQAFADRRTVRRDKRDMLRLYAVEPVLTLTGAAADHRSARTPAEIERFAVRLAAALGAPIGSPPDEQNDPLLAAIARDLRSAPGRALVLVGEEMPPHVHALGHWINHALGAFGRTLDLVEPVDPHEDDHATSIAALARDLRTGAVDTLLILGGNPAYDAPADLDFAEAVSHARLSVHLGLRRDETAVACRWHLPMSHPLESWSDLRSLDGTASVVQPLIVPLYATRTAHALLSMMAGEDATDIEQVRRTWRNRSDAADFDVWWSRVLEDGVVPGDSAVPVAIPSSPNIPTLPAPLREPAETLVLVSRPDPSVWDGTYACNAWLQECPKPVTSETWGNTLRLSPEDAERRGLDLSDAIRVTSNGRSVEAALFLDRGLATGVAALSLGYGRTMAGPIGTGLGASAYQLRASTSPSLAAGITLEAVGRADEPPRSRWLLDEDGRDIAPRLSLADLSAARSTPSADQPSLYPEQPYPRSSEADHAWAMVIDTNLCIGCNACVIACQSENNVPVVGPDEIRRGRDMHWLRIDAYDKNAYGASDPVFQPVPCMHCERAPCEPVCPVGASVHDHEGLNVQVYNRCVGTRFCQANCPYKVRRFNFFGYGAGQEYANIGENPLPARLNPDVSVRGRGVMEKCTYCVQRISRARRSAEVENRRLEEGEVVTACATACPTRAITFGDLNAPGSRVAQLRDEPQHHVLLKDVGTRPRTTYLASIRNANPELGDGA